MIITYIIIICFSTLLFSAVGTLCIRQLAVMLEAGRTPNDRDNHNRPTPKGGGLAVMIAIIGFLSVVGMNADVLFALLLLTCVSFIDDLHELSPITRLVFHGIAAGIIVAQLPDALMGEIVPYEVEYTLLTLLMVWFINLYNFMDGIDEITSLSTVFTMLGIICITLLHPLLPNALLYDSLIITSGIVGFWYFNRHPATIFLGDSGSIPLGGLVGWLLLSLAAHDMWMQALMLPSYYLIDSGITMAKRLAAGHKPWEAHSTHAYQRFVRAGNSHSHTTRLLALCYAVNVTLMVFSSHYAVYAPYCLIASYALAILMFLYFSSKPTSNSSSSAYASS
jgi:UDP-N-acetylmuramyl pentapeptide phosphotransferase/UDP-N-acetylglucosamine-1-phosphate transferase